MKTMKSSISGPLLLLLLVLSGTSSVLGLGVSRSYTYHDIYKSWQDSQNYCRDHCAIKLHFYPNSNVYKGALATLLTQDVSDRYLKQYKAWLGLPQWMSPTSGPRPDDKCPFVSFNSKSVLRNDSCEGYFFFICQNISTSTYMSTFTFVPQSKTWSEAKQHCLETRAHLANSPISAALLDKAVAEQNFPIWIGLHRNGENEWQWINGFSKYRDWANNEPRNTGDCVSINSLDKRFATQDCTTRLPFLCFSDNLVLIKEEKTWEEALEVCRGLGSPDQYDLISAEPGDDLDYLMYQILRADTDEVWSGLRFLAGSWMWVDGAQQKFPDLPDCPQLEQRCGAFSKNSLGTVEPRDCSERKNILCYKKN